MTDPRDLFKCPDCGEQEHMLFDASAILDRAFEDVWFLLKLDEHGSLVAEGDPKDADYLSDFRMEKHLKTAAEMAAQSPSLVYCPKCREPLE